jgi:hypothetical protein
MAGAFDFRSRTLEDVTVITAAELAARIPALLAERGALAAAAFQASGLSSFTVAVDEVVQTWRLDGDGALAVVEGDVADGPRADLPAEWFSDIVTDQRSAVALMVAALPVMARGRIEHLIRWEKVLRALVDGRPPPQAGAVDFVDAEGAPLDLDASFSLDDDPATLTHFLAQAGYLVVRGVIGAADRERLAEEMDTWFAAMSPEDERAWYAQVGDAHECVRVTNLRVDELAFPFADRLAPLAALTGAAHRYGGSDLLRKPIGVTEGLSDLPWHRDCELGMHSYRCPSLTAGISITPSGADNGQLGVIAGSHRVNVGLLDVGRVDLPAVFLATEPGDVTVHLSCTLHCATPPVHAERRVTYSTFRLPGDADALDRGIKAVRDQAGRDTYAPA